MIGRDSGKIDFAAKKIAELYSDFQRTFDTDRGEAEVCQQLSRDLGAAVAAIGGFPSLHNLKDEIEDRYGITVCVWANRSWEGLTTPHGDVWS